VGVRVISEGIVRGGEDGDTGPLGDLVRVWQGPRRTKLYVRASARPGLKVPKDPPWVTIMVFSAERGLAGIPAVCGPFDRGVAAIGGRRRQRPTIACGISAGWRVLEGANPPAAVVPSAGSSFSSSPGYEARSSGTRARGRRRPYPQIVMVASVESMTATDRGEEVVCVHRAVAW
jgi:hypothetical protein